jgi:hypothetical protein
VDHRKDAGEAKNACWTRLDWLGLSWIFEVEVGFLPMGGSQFSGCESGVCGGDFINDLPGVCQCCLFRLERSSP